MCVSASFWGMPHAIRLMEWYAERIMDVEVKIFQIENEKCSKEKAHHLLPQHLQ